MKVTGKKGNIKTGCAGKDKKMKGVKKKTGIGTKARKKRTMKRSLRGERLERRET